MSRLATVWTESNERKDLVIQMKRHVEYSKVVSKVNQSKSSNANVSENFKILKGL